jgi:elongation factor 2
MAKMIDKIKKIVSKQELIRNIAIAAHIDHGKTTLSDNLISGAGMLSEDLAGKACVLDFHEDEAERGITIDSANVSMVHDLDGVEHLINLIDTPGHVDFGGDVTRAMRAVDGAVVVACAVEGVMPQTETVLRQALKERVKPILFINKVDRLIKELKLTPEAMQKRFIGVINHVNQLISKIATEEYKEKWKVNVADGSVCFGSAFHNWALSVPYMEKNNVTFKEVVSAYDTDDDNILKELKKKAPLHRVLLNAVIRHLPNPKDAQGYRIPKIWHGETESVEGKSLKNCDPKGPVAFVVTKIVIDPHAGEVAAGRLFSGTVHAGDTLKILGTNRNARVQQVSVYNGPKRELLEEVGAGNIIGMVGLKDVFAGDTISSIEMEPLEAIKHIFDPVVTKAVEAKKAADLPKIVEVLRQVGKEDPSVHVEINEETGQHLISGMGELHLEVIENRIVSEKKVDIKTSPPIVVYREAVRKKSLEIVEGKSPNKHNKFYIYVEKLDDKLSHVVHDLSNVRLKKRDDNIVEQLMEGGLSRDDAKKVMAIYDGNIFVNETKGIVHLGEVIELVLDMFEEVMKNGPLCKEPCINLKVAITDMKLHEDTIHRGPAQVYPAVRDGIKDAMRLAEPTMYEPMQILKFDAPGEFLGEITKLVSNKRGVVNDMIHEEDSVSVIAKLPVGEMFGLSADLRSSTGGRGSFFVQDQMFEPLPFELQEKKIKEIRERKGLSDAQ